MREAPFYAKDMSIEAQKFLYACAFWAVAADEQLKPAEQEWLVKQFGVEGATKSLDEFVALESNAFFDAFDCAAAALSVDEKQKIYPQLEAWLLSCIEVDSAVAVEERKIIEKISERLSSNPESARTQKEPVSQQVSSVRLGSSAMGSIARHESAAAERVLAGHTGEVTCLDGSPDGKYIVSGSEDGTVRLWDLASGSAVKVLKGHESGIGDVCFCDDGRKILSGDRFGQIRLWDAASGKSSLISIEKKPGGITGLAVCADKKLAVFSSDIGIAGILDLTSLRGLKLFGEKKRGALHDVAASRDGKFILTGGDDKTIRLWDAGSCLEKMVFQGHDDGVISVCFSSDSKQVLSGSRDNTIRLWDTMTGEETRLFRGHTFSVCSVTFNLDGTRIVSASWDHTVKIWNKQTGEIEFNIESMDSRFSSVILHADGRNIVAGGSDKNIHVVGIV